MRSRVVLALPDGESVELGHGDMIGRLWSCALCLDDPRISEAHALVSLRGHELRLLALRGRFMVDGRPISDVTLAEGQHIALASGLEVVVDAVEVPALVLGLLTEGMPPRALPGTCALVVDPEPGLAPAGHPTAVAHVWCQPDGWRVRPVGEATRALDVGAAVVAGGRTWRAVAVATDGSHEATRIDASLDAPLRVVARYDTVHIFRDGKDPAVLQGMPARLLTELVAFGKPVPWAIVAEELWPGDVSRKRLDMALLRLRRHLREQGVRTDLVRADGAGCLELLLRPGDAAEDQQ